MQKVQVKSGARTVQYVNAGLGAIKSMKGKTHEEIYGKEKAENIRKINSKKNSGSNNKNFGGIWHGFNPGKSQKGKTIEEIYGKEKSELIKNKLSIKSSGKNNNMFGKPSPMGSGNGWSGWYEKRFFKSLLELSFLINYVDRFKLKCVSAEKKEYKIKYKDHLDKDRNYFPDFILNDKYMIEVKPKHLRGSFDVLRKKEAALIFCEENNLKYKIITPPRLSNREIGYLIESEKVVLIDRYKEKYEIWKQNHTV
jgi:hypothetical protein